MAGIHTTDLGTTFQIPTTQLGRIAEGVQELSVLATLSPERPTLYGNVQAVRMSQAPRAEIVGEGAQKGLSSTAFRSTIANPIKIQSSVRMTSEVNWLDTDHRLLIVDELTEKLSLSMAKAVDLIGIHGINPATGADAASVPVHVSVTENQVEEGASPDNDLTAAIGLVIADRYTPTGIAFDTGYAFSVATQRDANGNRLHPEMGFGDGGSWNGLKVVRSATVNGLPERANGAPDVRAIVGDWSQLKWGFQRRIPVQKIEYGSPDGGDDLQHVNEVIFRAEAVLYVAIFDTNAFAVVENTP